MYKYSDMCKNLKVNKKIQTVDENQVVLEDNHMAMVKSQEPRIENDQVVKVVNT